jgi:hypothetical protein
VAGLVGDWGYVGLGGDGGDLVLLLQIGDDILLEVSAGIEGRPHFGVL